MQKPAMNKERDCEYKNGDADTTLSERSVGKAAQAPRLGP
jgi:hypothetical protein